ncbi:histidine phosphatase family protein [Planosporangium thailandense]|uniref:phosphoglycerate mutase (2,3-diphosphoglycerate-dependent) n=1 Tax=Planosporangium thailandense TaxID=765197 RepID=A0ABX0XVW5_9ACTN|nr:histidine phosphatase family protein [Planosporangium thailandense]
MTVQLIYETHSISTDNEAGIATGWLPGELSDRGRDLARELGTRRRADSPAVVFASDLRRAAQTAEIAFGDSGIPVRLDPRLRECDYGRLNGASVAAVAAERRRRIDAPFPGGESYRRVVDRTRDFLADLVRWWDGRTVVVIAHSANRWALEHLVHGRSLDDLVDAPFNWQEGWRYVVGDAPERSR